MTPFPTRYAEARSRFLDAARARGAEPVTYTNPERGADGEELATDVVRIGHPDARFALVVASGTHGVEGPCGSGIQVRMLEDGLGVDLGDDVALVLIHAHNPYGFSHARRVTEEGVDLNRNFVDFTAPLPRNPGYDELHEHLVPSAWNGPARAAADTALAEFRERHGARAYQSAIVDGQWQHPTGLFYGGTGPTWAHRTIRTIARNHLAGFQHVAFLDLHTGLGPRGHGELIHSHDPHGPEYARVQGWYGEVTNTEAPEGGDSVSTRVVGTIDRGYREELAAGALSFVVVEYGTVPVDDVIGGLRLDHHVAAHASDDTALREAARDAMLHAFFGADARWQQDVWQRARDVGARAIAGMRG